MVKVLIVGRAGEINLGGRLRELLEQRGVIVVDDQDEMDVDSDVAGMHLLDDLMFADPLLLKADPAALVPIPGPRPEPRLLRKAAKVRPAMAAPHMNYH